MALCSLRSAASHDSQREVGLTFVIRKELRPPPLWRRRVTRRVRPAPTAGSSLGFMHTRMWLAPTVYDGAGLGTRVH